ncbi:MAG: N-acetylglucosamine-6-phosphate deacetylase [Candidatus Binatia bacterium]|nr:N-acetylglucosamine-6-phosphate deacetylase [Candidatus Binatia bacterium]
MHKVLIRRGRVLLPHGWRDQTDVRIEEGVIDRVDQDVAAPGARVIEAQGYLVVPGFVDLHLHGAFGLFCESGRSEQILDLSSKLPQFGVTGFLPTVATLPRRRLQAAVEAIAMAAGGEPGARILGIHLEGPFLNRHCAGAQNRRWMRPPDLAEFDDLVGRSSGLVKMITVAPELPGALPLIAAAAERGITVALGHSEASEELTLVAVDAGATHVTHLYNAMAPFHHREPGLVGVALSEPSLTVELIADGHHVRPRALELAWRARGGAGMVLVSDAVALGLPQGEYELLGKRCVVQNGAVRTAGGGALAGSALSLDQAVRNLFRWLPTIAPERVFEAAAVNPCRILGIDHAYGRIEAGYQADLVVLDQNYEVAYTIIGGRVVYERTGA